MQPSTVGILSVTEIFHDFSQPQLEMVAAICEPETYQKGDVILHEYDTSKALYVIGLGHVEIMMSPGLVGDAEQQEGKGENELHGRSYTRTAGITSPRDARHG